MKSIEAFIAELVSLDVKLSVDAGNLRCSAPSGVLTPALQAQLALRKPELLAFLASAKGDASGGASGAEPLLRPGARVDPIPLSHGQERIWSLVEMRPESGVYNTSTAYRLSGPINVLALEQSLNALAERHEILRTSFPAEQRVPRQQISGHEPLELPVLNIMRVLKRLPAEEHEAEILRSLKTEVHRPFDIRRGPLWRTLLLQIGPEEHVLSLTLHHIISDGASDAILLRELSSLYKAFAEGDAPKLPELPIQYADFACWQHARMSGDVGRRQLAYWKETLDGEVSELRLPIDAPREPDAAFRGASEPFTLPDTLASALARMNRKEQTGWFAMLLAAWCALLYRHTGQEDLVLCSPFAARDRAELEGLIGYFNNIVVMRANLSGDPSFRSLLGRVKRLGIEAADHQNLPLQRLLELPNLVRVPLTRGMFCFQDLSVRVLDLPGTTGQLIDIRKETADFDLAMYMQSTGKGKLSGVLEYDAGLFEREAILRLLRDFETVLEHVSADPDQPLSALPSFGPQRAEVEAALTGQAQIDDAVVVDLPDHAGTAAYLVLNEYDTPNLDDVRRHVRSAVPEYRVPRAFVPLDQLPLLANGKVDRAALPLPVLAADRPQTEYVAPRTELERKLAEIWKRALWLDGEVGIRDRFTDLGGHSLLSVQLVAALEHELQRPLPVSALLRLSTIEEMAEILEHAQEGGAEEDEAPLEISRENYHALLTYTASWVGERAKPESLVVGLNTEGTQEPLFWCLQRYGELTQLAKYLGADQPVYGMRSANRVMLRIPENIAALARQYVQEILATKPEGPFLLGGNCQAADIAFQIAKGLEALGHEVTQLVMLEKFVPEDYAGRVALLFGKKSDRNPYVYYHQPEIGWGKFYSGEHSIDLVPGKHAKFFQEPNVQGVTATIRKRLEEAKHVKQLTAANGGGDALAVPLRAGERRDVQKLPRAAYRARLSTREAVSAVPGEMLRMQVEIENASSVAWRAGDVSGIALANRWLNKKEEVVAPRDGRTPLAVELAPGARTTLELSAKVPRRTGNWLLELDLIDEGVTWFGDQGSARTRVQVDVRRRSLVRSTLKTLFQGAERRG